MILLCSVNLFFMSVLWILLSSILFIIYFLWWFHFYCSLY